MGEPPKLSCFGVEPTYKAVSASVLESEFGRFVNRDSSGHGPVWFLDK